MTTVHHSKVAKALDLLGITDRTEVASVLIGPHGIAVTRHAQPTRLGEDGEIVTETEYLELDHTPAIITGPTITSAVIDVSLTGSDGKTITDQIRLDNADGPVDMDWVTTNDIVETTPEGAQWAEFAAGDRRSVTFSIAGRGPISVPVSS